APRVTARSLPGEVRPETINVVRCADLELGRHDLVVLAVPARALPQAMAAPGAPIPARPGVLLASKGLVAPPGALPSAYVAERTRARALASLGGPAHAADALDHGAALVVASTDRGFSRQLTDLLNQASLYAERSTDTVGVELAGAAKNAAALAAAAAAPPRPHDVG